MQLEDDELTYATIGCFRRVYNELGFGFLESAYRGALLHECTRRGLPVTLEVPIPLYYSGVIVATYRVDMLIDRRLMVEVKSCTALRNEHVKQVLNYLRATDIELALLLNFGEQPTVRRFTIRNEMKRRSEETRDSRSAVP